MIFLQDGRVLHKIGNKWEIFFTLLALGKLFGTFVKKFSTFCLR